MKKQSNFLLSLLAVLLYSCNSSEDVISEESPIQKMLTEYYNSVTPKTRGTSNLVVTNISQQYYQIIDDSVTVVTPISRAVTDSTIFDLSTVQFRIGQKNGYALLSEDERINSVLFFTDNGSISDTANIPALKNLIVDMPYTASGIINNQNVSSRAEYNTIVYPLCEFSWGQSFPYNNCMPKCSSGKCSILYNNHNPAGYVTTATAQAIATIGKFRGTFYGCKDIDFSKLPTDSVGFVGNTFYQTQIATFFHEVALCCQTKFSCGYSYGNIRAVYHYLTDMDYDCFYAKGCVDINKLTTNLEAGYPHIISGGDTGIDTWIIDGIRSNGYSYMEYHFNWGNGTSNCWTSSYTYTYYEGSSDKYSQLYINGVNN